MFQGDRVNVAIHFTVVASDVADDLFVSIGLL